MPLRNHFIGFFCFCCSFVQAQQANLDSLESVIAFNKKDVGTGWALNTVSMELVRTDITKAKKYLWKAIDIGKSLNHARTLSAAYSLMITIYQNAAQIDSALFYLHSLKDLSEKYIGEDINIIQGNYYSSAGLFFKKEGNYKEALNHFKKSLIIAEREGNKVFAAGQAVNIGNSYLNLSDYNSALMFYLQALKGFEAIDNKKGQSFCYQNICECYTELKKFDAALKYVNKSIQLKKDLDDKRGLGNAEQALGRIYLGLRNFNQSFLHYSNALTLAKDMKLFPDQVKTYFNIGKLYLEKGDAKNAVSYFQQSKKVAGQLHDSTSMAAADLEITSTTQNIMDQKEFEKKTFGNIQTFKEGGNISKEVAGYKHLAEYYTSKKEFDKALEYTNRYHELNDSIQNTEIQTRFKKIEEQYNLEKNEKQIAILKKDQEISRQQLRVQKIIIVTSVLVTLFILVGIWLAINRYKLRQKMKELELRNQIATDLHDEVGSSLSSIHVLSNMATRRREPDQKLNDTLVKISSNAHDTMERMSDIVWAIHPANDTLEQLIYRMKEFASDILEPLDIHYEFTIENDLSSIKLSVNQRRDLYLVFKEAVNNAAKYSCCKNIEIELIKQEDKLLLRITDDGEGFETATVVHGNGLNNMQQRAKVMGGKLWIDSATGKGTTVSLLTKA
jgi:signal transduction histidine kinase